MLEDWKTADVPERTRAALRLLECMTVRPLELDASFVQGLVRDGLDEAAIREAANVGFHYNLINRVADAFDFKVPGPKEKQRLAALLNLAGKVIKGSEHATVWVRSGDGRIRPTEVERGRERMLSADGETSPELRRAVEAFVTAQWGVTRPGAPEVPPELVGYLKKLARGAYKLVDEDVSALREAGYSTDALYELTMVGATGAALVGLEQLFGALYGAEDARESVGGVVR